MTAADDRCATARGRCARGSALARMRVALGFVCGVLVLWLAQPTGDDAR